MMQPFSNTAICREGAPVIAAHAPSCDGVREGPEDNPEQVDGRFEERHDLAVLQSLLCPTGLQAHRSVAGQFDLQASEWNGSVFTGFFHFLASGLRLARPWFGPPLVTLPA